MPSTSEPRLPRKREVAASPLALALTVLLLHLAPIGAAKAQPAAAPTDTPTAVTTDTPAAGNRAIGDVAAETAAQAEAVLGGLVRDQRSSFALAVLTTPEAELFSRSWGVAEPDSAQPIDPDATLIDLNSIKKLFIAVAIAQLIDRGRIRSFEDPANAYLKTFVLRKAFGREVTIRELATHNAALDESLFGPGPLADDPAQFFVRRHPGYFANVGPYSAYSNYGTLVLAQMVADIAGMTFAQYATREILHPLGMTGTHLGASGPPLVHRVLPFQPKNPGQRVPGVPLKPLDAPLGNGQAVATTRDMSRFLKALLGGGANPAVITPTMRRLLFTVHQSNGPRGSGHGLLFDVLPTDAGPLFNHGGKGEGLNCLLTVDPLRGLGLFYCYGHVQTRLDFDPALYPPEFERIKDPLVGPQAACRAAASPPCSAATPPDSAQDGWHDDWDRLLGLYVSYGRHHHGPSRLRTIIHPTRLRVERDGDALKIDGVGGYREVAPGDFAHPARLETYSFTTDPESGDTVLSASGRPSAYARPEVIDDPRIVPRLLALTVLIAMSGGLVVLLPPYRLRWPARLIAAGHVALVTGGTGVLFGLHALGEPYFAGIAWPLELVRALALACLPMTLLLVSKCRPEPAKSGRTWAERLAAGHLVMVKTSAVVMVSVLMAVEMIGFGRIT